MTECSKSKITTVQLFFLSFAYVFSGLFLIRERSFLSLLLPLGTVFLFSCFGYLFLKHAQGAFTEKARFLTFLSCGRPHLVSKALAVFLIFLCAAEMLLSCLLFTYSVTVFSEFLSFTFVAAAALVLAIWIGAHGLTVLGRFSELFVFMIGVLLFRTVFFDFQTVEYGAFSKDLYALLTVTPAPLFYLFSMTALQSTAMPKPLKRLAYIPLLTLAGAAAAILCAFLFMLFGMGENSVFFLLFGWTASIIRLSLLISVCAGDCLIRGFGRR